MATDAELIDYLDHKTRTHSLDHHHTGRMVEVALTNMNAKRAYVMQATTFRDALERLMQAYPVGQD